jgi:hypothetical protein
VVTDWRNLVLVTLRATLSGLPEFAALCGYVESSEVARYLLVDAAGVAIEGEEARRGRLYERFASLLVRCLEGGATAGVTEEAFLPLYSELEEYMQATAFEVLFWAPLAKFEAAVAPVWVDSDLAVRPLEDAERAQVWDLGQSGVIGPIDADTMRFALETTYSTAKYGPVDASRANEKFRLAVTAMRLMKSANPAAYVTVHRSARPLLFHRLAGYGAGDTPRPARPRVFCLEKQDVQPLQELYQSLTRLPQSSPLKLPLDRFERAIDRDKHEDSLIDQWVALEALFLKRSERLELSYRAALRIARFVGEDAAEREGVFHNMRLSYNTRSDVVHGEQPKADVRQVASDTEEILRRALRAEVTNPGSLNVDRLDAAIARGGSSVQGRTLE